MAIEHGPSNVVYPVVGFGLAKSSSFNAGSISSVSIVDVIAEPERYSLLKTNGYHQPPQSRQSFKYARSSISLLGDTSPVTSHVLGSIMTVQSSSAMPSSNDAFGRTLNPIPSPDS